MKFKIRRLFIYLESGIEAVPHILDLTNEDVTDKEISYCIQEQLFKQ